VAAACPPTACYKYDTATENLYEMSLVVSRQTKCSKTSFFSYCFFGPSFVHGPANSAHLFDCVQAKDLRQRQRFKESRVDQQAAMRHCKRLDHHLHSPRLFTVPPAVERVNPESDFLLTARIVVRDDETRRIDSSVQYSIYGDPVW